MTISSGDLHQDLIIVDGHCDTILELYLHQRSFFTANKKGHIDLPRMQAGKINLQFLAFYIEPAYKPSGALARLLELLAYFRLLEEESQGVFSVVKSKEDLKGLGPQSTLFLLAVEGGEVLEGKSCILRILYELGFRCLTLTWNQRNCLADGVWEKESRGGLTQHGREVVSEMNRLGMLIDVSHLSENGFWDVLSLSKKPIAATHSCCYSLFKHPRNLKDEQFKALKENGGIAGINFFPGFLGEGKVTLDRVVDHLEHAVSIAGIEHVGLGSDFDGIHKTPIGLEDAAKLPRLTERLVQRGWKEDEIRKVMGGNFLRVLSRVLA